MVIPQSFYVEDSEGKEVVEIERGWSLGPNFDIKFSNRLSLRGPAPVTLQMGGDWNDPGADFWRDELSVASIYRYPENRRGLSSRYAYGIEVAAKVESSLASI
jgi:hypothetical protein